MVLCRKRTHVAQAFVFNSDNPTRLLNRIEHGYLVITTSVRQYTFGRADAADHNQPVCEIRVLNDAFWLRLAAME